MFTPAKGAPRNNMSTAQAKLVKALNNIAYAHVNTYAKAIGIQANAQKAAAAAAAAATANPTPTNVNKLSRANAAAQTAARNTTQVGAQTEQALGAIGAASPSATVAPISSPAAASATNAEAKVAALIARIEKGNFTNNTGKYFNYTRLPSNYKPFVNNSRVKQAIAVKYTPTNGQGNAPVSQQSGN